MGFGEDEESVVGLPNKSIFRYNSPLVQVCLIGLVCFCCPGMFNALSGMRGGGQVDATATNNANTSPSTPPSPSSTSWVVTSTTSSTPVLPSSLVAQPMSSMSALSFTTTTTSTRASPLSLPPSSKSEQDCSGRGRELSWRRTPRRGGRVHTYCCSGASLIWGASSAGSSPSFWTTTEARLRPWTTILTLGSCASCPLASSSRWQSYTRATWFETTTTTVPTSSTPMCRRRLSRF